jgi:hypothetical protein
MQGQPKVHKPTDDQDQYSFRPIISGHDSITAPISKHLAHILIPITIKTPFQVQDSLHLKDKLLQFIIPDTYILTSFDITNMYPSIPAIAALRRLQEQDHTFKQRTSMTIDDIISLQESVLRLVHFQWLGVYFAQTDSCAMGDSTSTPISNAYMSDFEKDILTKYRHLHDPPHIPPPPPL